MWHDTWPPLPPSGHRPPDAPPFTSPGDQPLALGLGATAGAGVPVWATGQLAGLAFGHTRLDLTPADVAHILWHLPQHWSDPQLAGVRHGRPVDQDGDDAVVALEGRLDLQADEVVGTVEATPPMLVGDGEPSLADQRQQHVTRSDRLGDDPRELVAELDRVDVL